ncbi:1235_t:CDS:2, partial [Entrophospora sp. SA101]
SGLRTKKEKRHQKKKQSVSTHVKSRVLQDEPSCKRLVVVVNEFIIVAPVGCDTSQSRGSGNCLDERDS